MQFKAEVKVNLKKGVLDPQGSTVQGAVTSMGYQGVADMRIGKVVTFSVQADSAEAAKALVEELGKKILTNPVMETFTYSIEEAN